MRKIIIVNLLLLFTFIAYSQNVAFYSQAFEEGIRRHLALNDTVPVLQNQMDTITYINLSGLGISDIRDVVHLPNVKGLDLSYNSLTDVSSLLSLETLAWLNLSNNELEDISILALSQVDSMVVNVSNNHIADFSYFFYPTECLFTFLGMGFQTYVNDSYLDIYQLYADIDGGRVTVKFRGYSNLDNVFLECGKTYVRAEMKGNYNTVNIDEDLTSTTRVLLSNGDKGDSTYVIRPVRYDIEPNQTLTIETGLPDKYRIGFANALYGTVMVDGQMLTYSSTADNHADTLFLSYYLGRELKGFAEYYIGEEPIGPTDVENISDLDLQFKLTWQDGLLYVECTQNMSGDCQSAIISVWNYSGQLLATKKVDTGYGVMSEMDISGNQGEVIIVQVEYCNKRIIRKCYLTR